MGEAAGEEGQGEGGEQATVRVREWEPGAESKLRAIVESRKHWRAS